jgi:hypothetical protein
MHRNKTRLPSALIPSTLGRTRFPLNLLTLTLLTLTLGLGLGAAGCHALSKAEREMYQQSPEALCKGVVKTYQARDAKAFLDLAISHRDLKELMASVKVPESARREAKLSTGEYERKITDSLATILATGDVDWPQAAFEMWQPTRNPVEIAPGYHMLLGRLFIVAGDRHWSQSITIVEIGKGRYFMGDFSPFKFEP